MSLIELAEKEPEKFASFTVEQIVGICDDGKLRDNSETAKQFRRFLGLQSSLKLAEYASYCLEGNFERRNLSGHVLQDVVNEIGRRLGYKVTDGLYRGKSNAIGFDGLWDDGIVELVVEIKTTDVYLINLDTVFGYGEKLNLAGKGSGAPRNCLIVVGRQDTGGLEAQVRGSRYAWNVRLISVDALIKLMLINEDVDDIGLVKKIRQTLLPIEYTRVDNIVDLVFEAQQEQEVKDPLEKEDQGVAVDPDHKQSYEFTPKPLLDAKRLALVSAFYKKNGQDFEKKTKTAFSDTTGATHVVCAVSKRYQGVSTQYWYALHPHWLKFIQESPQGFLILGGMDSQHAYAIPADQVTALLPKLNQTTKEREGRSYWHIHLGEVGGEGYINLTKVGEKFTLTPFKFQLS